MRIADQIVGWLMVVMGLLHSSFTPRPLTMDALWFLSGGLYLLLLGGTNLLRTAYAGVAPGTRWVALAANLAGLVFMALVLAQDPGMFRGPPGVVAVLIVLATFFSVVRRPVVQSSNAGAA